MALKVRYGGPCVGAGMRLRQRAAFRGSVAVGDAPGFRRAGASRYGSRRSVGPRPHALNYRFRTGTDHGNPTV